MKVTTSKSKIDAISLGEAKISGLSGLTLEGIFILKNSKEDVRYGRYTCNNGWSTNTLGCLAILVASMENDVLREVFINIKDEDAVTIDEDEVKETVEELFLPGL